MVQAPLKVESIEEEPKYRYVCDGCTNNALFSTTLMQGIKITCQECGKEQITVPGNWVIL